MKYTKKDIDDSLNNGYIYILDKDTIKEFLNTYDNTLVVSSDILVSNYIEIYLTDNSKINITNKNIFLTFDIKTKNKTKYLATESKEFITTDKYELIKVV